MKVSIQRFAYNIVVSSIVLTTLLGCTDQKQSNVHKFEEKKLNQPLIIGPFDATDYKQMPASVPMTNEQKLYTIGIAQTAIQVIEKQITLDQSEKTLFGPGEYNVEKDASKPILSKNFPSRNFRMRTISIDFGRKDEKSPWRAMGLNITPRNFPNSAYQMDLPYSFFEGMTLEKAYAEERKRNNETQLLHIFKFQSAKNGIKLKYQFETRSDLSSVSDKYPKSFHYLEVVREGD
jgi:hypothetical protein